MKPILFLLFLLGSVNAFCQTHESVESIEITTTPVSSYVVNNYGKIHPGVVLNGSKPFFLRANTFATGVPSPNKNFVRSEKLLVEESLEKNLSGLPPEKISRTYSYLDGIGRTMQTLELNSTPAKNDYVSFHLYDPFGREQIRPLRYGINAKGEFRSSPALEHSNFYAATPNVVSDPEAFAEVQFDDSPLNQVKKSLGIGWKWHNDVDNKASTSNVRLNETNEVLLLLLDASGLPVYSPTSFYPANALLITEEIDEAGRVKRSYKDLRDNLVLERVGDGSSWQDLYYMNDAGGKVLFVFPPEGSSRFSEYASSDRNLFLNTWCYQYKYDQYNRLSEKKGPGGSWEFYVYDRWDRVVAKQDGNQRTSSSWTYTKFDSFNRPIISGIMTGSRLDVETAARNNTVRFEERANNSVGYTNTSFPSHTEQNLLSITYYDCYNFISYSGWDQEQLSYAPRTEDGLVDLTKIFKPVDPSRIYDPVVKGYVTGSKVRQLNTNKWINSVRYYDKKYRVVQVISENHLGGSDVITSQYDFVGKKKVQRRRHSANTTNTILTEQYDYDHAGRLLTLRHSINSQAPIVMVANSYNELGQLVEKNIHQGSDGKFLQSLDYRYNIQGWVTSINNSTLSNDGRLNNDTDDLFGMEVDFESAGTTISNGSGGSFTSKKYFDGNVSAARWKSKTPNNTIQKITAFDYDVLKRFKNSYYSTSNGGTWSGDAGFFNETVSAYDRNGNVGAAANSTLSRNGIYDGIKSRIDHLAYRYQGNELKNVKDGSSNSSGFEDKPGVDLTVNEYSYDANGNVKEDLNRSITSITYNHLNLPTEIQITRATLSPVRTDRIVYSYDATGKKLSKTVLVGNQTVWRTDYIDGFQYDNSKLSFFTTSEGRVVLNGDNYEYEYFLKDAQGNTRVVCGYFKETNTYLATMELKEDNQERNTYGFKNLTETRVIGNNYSSATTNVAIPKYSARCNGYRDATTTLSPVGPSKYLKVSANDAVYTEVFSRFNNVKTSSSTLAANLLVSAITGTFSVSNAENPSLWQGMNENVPVAGTGVPSAGSIPKAYLAILYFDNNYVFKRAAVKGITATSFQSFEKLSLSFTPDVDGHLYIYVINESNESSSVDVYFDDLYIIHQKGNVVPQIVQSCDYYPFGLAYNEYQGDRLKYIPGTGEKIYEPMLRNRILFQGQELQRDLNLNWYQFAYRMHDPAIGRFHALDPLAHDYKHNSPYAFSENKLVNSVELEGLESKVLYNSMKMVSPIAFKFTIGYGTHESKIGFEYSIGIPKMLPFSYRFGQGFFYNSYDLIQKTAVLETRETIETGYMGGLFSFQSTKYEGANPQTTGMVTIGGPFGNISYENDWFPQNAMNVLDPFSFHPFFGGDGGDRWRSAALQANFGALNIGFRIATGDPGPQDQRLALKHLGGTAGTYAEHQLGEICYQPNSIRLGAVYFGFGGFKLGIDSEYYRNKIQNEFAHEYLLRKDPSPLFQVLPKNDQLYLQLGGETSTQY